ncbi:MAG: DUF1934 domain-containing protein [Clostridioides sp.]|nr:DUF1934 domain-containing protein [Clostridioides sp.]
MFLRQVDIYIKTTQYSDGEVSPIEFHGEANMYKRGKSIFVNYNDDNTKNTMKITPTEFTIKKTGQIDTVMKFKENCETGFKFLAQGRFFLMTVFTEKYSVVINKVESNSKMDIEKNTSSNQKISVSKINSEKSILNFDEKSNIKIDLEKSKSKVEEKDLFSSIDSEEDFAMKIFLEYNLSIEQDFTAKNIMKIAIKSNKNF